jgi:hypothetical protein
VDEQVEHLRFDMDRLAGAPQLLPRGIDFEIPEAKAQGIPPSATRVPPQREQSS